MFHLQDETTFFSLSSLFYRALKPAHDDKDSLLATKNYLTANAFCTSFYLTTSLHHIDEEGLVLVALLV
jgi:hypothetical protein